VVISFTLKPLSLGDNKQNHVPAFQMLYAPEALEAAVHHDGHACAQGFTFLHAGETQEETALFLFTK
jgi:hypothetical protein